MKRLRNCIVALLLGSCAPLLVWVGLGSAMYQKSKEANGLKRVLPNLTCAVDTDCPPGYVCLNGRCVLAKQ